MRARRLMAAMLPLLIGLVLGGVASAGGIDQAGDAIRQAFGGWVRVTSPSDGDVLTYTSATGDWGAAAASASGDTAIVRRADSSNQTISDTTVTLVTYTVEDADSNGLGDLGTDAGRLTIQTAGLYLVSGHATWVDESNETLRQLCIRRYNSSDSLREELCVDVNSINGGGTSQEVTTLWDCDAGDYVQAYVYHASGTDADLFRASLRVAEQ